MVVNKIIAAKISADYTGWADSDEVAECAEKGIISIQRHYMQLRTRIGFFAVGKGEKIFPIDKLTDIDHIQFLIIALPDGAVSPEIMSILSSVDAQREEKINARHNNDREKTRDFPLGTEIDLVFETGEDPSTGEKRYDCMPDDGILGGSVDIDRVADSKKHTRGYTISEVDNYAKKAKKWKVPSDIKGEQILQGTGIGQFVAAGKVCNVGDANTKLLSRIEPGDIVVAVSLRPDELQTFCQKAAGFVIDKGGVTSHTANFARMNDLVAVVGTLEATRVLKDGQKIMISEYGFVYI